MATRLLIRDADPRWIFVGCLLPDVPWILQRITSRVAPQVDPYEIRLYAIVQATLAFSLLLCGALALLSARPRKIFVILALNALLHLLLDSVEVKWGNGVHLMAPLSWEMLNLGWFWPESLPSLVMTGLGLAFASICWLKKIGPRVHLSAGTPLRRGIAAGLLLGYLACPIALRSLPERADNHFVGTLKERSQRPGRYVEFDRNRFIRGETGDSLRTFAGETLRLEESPKRKTGTASLKARFEDESTLRVVSIHFHPAGLRDAASYLGLALICLVWFREGRADASESSRRKGSGFAPGA